MRAVLPPGPNRGVGTVTPEVAAQTGLAAGTPVITGTGDSTAEAISVGLVEPGTAFFQYGSSMFYYYCTDCFVGSYVSPQGRTLQPDRRNHEFYQEHYPIFRDLYLENRDRMHRMQK